MGKMIRQMKVQCLECIQTALVLLKTKIQVKMVPYDIQHFASFDCKSGFHLLGVDSRDSKCFGIISFHENCAGCTNEML